MRWAWLQLQRADPGGRERVLHGEPSVPQPDTRIRAAEALDINCPELAPPAVDQGSPSRNTTGQLLHQPRPLHAPHDCFRRQPHVGRRAPPETPLFRGLPHDCHRRHPHVGCRKLSPLRTAVAPPEPAPRCVSLQHLHPRGARLASLPRLNQDRLWAHSSPGTTREALQQKRPSSTNCARPEQPQGYHAPATAQPPRSVRPIPTPQPPRTAPPLPTAVPPLQQTRRRHHGILPPLPRTKGARATTPEADNLSPLARRLPRVSKRGRILLHQVQPRPQPIPQWPPLPRSKPHPRRPPIFSRRSHPPRRQPNPNPNPRTKPRHPRESVFSRPRAPSLPRALHLGESRAAVADGPDGRAARRGIQGIDIHCREPECLCDDV